VVIFECRNTVENKMPRLFSYVVDHDHGFAPNPCDGLCTLAKCKFGSNGWKNIIELAKEGDWIVGTGGANLKKSAGRGKLVYAMIVNEKKTLAEYCLSYGQKRIDAGSEKNDDGRFALMSRHFFYFGRNAIQIPKRFEGIEKKGPGFRSKFSDKLICDFVNWLEMNFTGGVHGAPCMPDPDIRIILKGSKPRVIEGECNS